MIMIIIVIIIISSSSNCVYVRGYIAPAVDLNYISNICQINTYRIARYPIFHVVDCVNPIPAHTKRASIETKVVKLLGVVGGVQIDHSKAQLHAMDMMGS